MTFVRLIQECNKRHDHCTHSLGPLSTDFPLIREINLGTFATIRSIEGVRLIQVSLC